MRESEIDVFHNFQFNKIENDLNDILAGKVVDVKGYSRHPNRVAIPRKYKYQNEEIIIIEGVISISTQKLRDISNFRIFKDISEDLLKSRLSTYYQWKGLDLAKIDELFKKRKKDEYDIIDKDRIFADLIL